MNTINTINQDFKFNIPINENTSVRGYINEIVIRTKNNSFAPSTIMLDIKIESYINTMPTYSKPIKIDPLVISRENYELIMVNVFEELGSFINEKLGETLASIIQENT
jgi:hypothetical protein